VFKHALIRDAAYASLLKSRRRELHLAIARVLAEHAHDAEAPPELLAHHYTQASEPEAAWPAWRRAGELAMARSALREAVEHFATALRLLATLPEAPERARQALDVQILYGQALAATKGYGAREVTDAFARARELAQEAGATAELRSVLFGLWASLAGKGELRDADELADELLAMGERSGVPGELVWGHLARGIDRYSRGEVAGAREDLGRAVVLYRGSDRPASPSDPGVMALSYAAVNSWMLGLFDEARAHSRESLALARELQNPFAEAWAGFFTGALHVFLREPDRALEHTDPLLATCTEHKFSLFVGLLTIVRGAALSLDGRHAEGCRELRSGLDLFRATGQRVAHRLYRAWLAEACLAAGAVDEAADTVRETLAIAPDERLFEPELHRLQAEILAIRGARPEEVEASYRESIERAHQQGARALELRAATSWARWRGGRRPSEEALQRLAEVCEWFPEAVTTRDLDEARALLRRLSASR
jgi:tetratricopeptide (TPR) repeat protein